jgi:hypothetical protein
VYTTAGQVAVAFGRGAIQIAFIGQVVFVAVLTLIRDPVGVDIVAGLSGDVTLVG